MMCESALHSDGVLAYMVFSERAPVLAFGGLSQGELRSMLIFDRWHHGPEGSQLSYEKKQKSKNPQNRKKRKNREFFYFGLFSLGFGLFSVGFPF